MFVSSLNLYCFKTYLQCLLVYFSVSGARGQHFLAGPKCNVCCQVPATRGNYGGPKPQAGAESGASGTPLHQGLTQTRGHMMVMVMVVMVIANSRLPCIDTQTHHPLVTAKED